MLTMIIEYDNCRVNTFSIESIQSKYKRKSAHRAVCTTALPIVAQENTVSYLCCVTCSVPYALAPHKYTMYNIRLHTLTCAPLLVRWQREIVFYSILVSTEWYYIFISIVTIFVTEWREMNGKMECARWVRELKKKEQMANRRAWNETKVSAYSARNETKSKNKNNNNNASHHRCSHH